LSIGNYNPDRIPKGTVLYDNNLNAGKILFTSASLNQTTISGKFNATIDFGFPLIAIPRETFIEKIILPLKKYGMCYDTEDVVWHCEFNSINDINKIPYLILEADNFTYALHYSNYTVIVLD
jgi:hypothetical protein